MDLAALLLAVVAIALFCVARYVNVGFALLTASLICQFVHLTGTVVTTR